MTRIEWNADGSRLLAHRPGGTPRVHDLAGQVLVEIIPKMDVLDARWAGDRVTTIDVGHRQHWWSPEGAVVRVIDYGDAGKLAARARLAARGARVIRDDQMPVVTQPDSRPRAVWIHDRPAADADADISDDGRRVVIAASAVAESGRRQTTWSVHAPDDNREIHTEVSDAERLVFAFDVEARRLAYAAPMPMGPIGVVEVGGDHLLAYPEYMSGADAVSLDPRGVIAAFAAPGRIRFDDLASGSTLTLAIDGAPVAIAFSPDSRALAYLTDDGKVAVVPVP